MPVVQTIDDQAALLASGNHSEYNIADDQNRFNDVNNLDKKRSGSMRYDHLTGRAQVTEFIGFPPASLRRMLMDKQAVASVSILEYRAAIM